MREKFRQSLSASSKNWVRRQERDLYAKKAKSAAFRSRAAYKLIQMDERDRIFRPNDWVVDLGAAPGGWTQVACDRIFPANSPRTEGSRVIAIDLLPMGAIAGAQVVIGDFTDALVQAQMESMIGARPMAKVEVVLSDMSPNISGVRTSDNARAEFLWRSALVFANRWLVSGGHFVCKLFQSAEAEAFVRDCRNHFAQVAVRKPLASRDESREVFVVAKGFHG